MKNSVQIIFTKILNFFGLAKASELREANNTIKELNATIESKNSTINTIKAGKVASPFMLVVDTYENVIESTKVIINIVKNHLIASFLGFLFLLFFFFISLPLFSSSFLAF